MSNAKKKKKVKAKQQRTSFFVKGDWPVYLTLTLLLLVAFGLMALFSASYASAYIKSGDSYQYIQKQAICAAIGLVAMVGFGMLNYHELDRRVGLFYAAALILLAIVHFTCDPLNGATRWLYWDNAALSWVPTFQVSELAKFVMILVTARLVCVFHASNKKGPQGLIYPLLAVMPVVYFVFKQPHLSGTIIILGIVLVMIVMSGVGTPYLLVLAGLSVPLGYVGYKIAMGISYVSDRLDGMTLIVEEMEWQTKQSIYAIGSGGLTGLGFGNGVQKQMWLPEATNDFIFSVICEELGFLGAMLVIFLFVVFIIQGFYFAMEAADLYGSMLAIGITAQIAIQFAFNIGVVTSLLPNTGISLPFFSSGGTSLIMLLAQVGVLISVARAGNAAKAERAKEKEAQVIAQVVQAAPIKNKMSHPATALANK
ncbi:MAG: FtsW/RodA/SpoVE family cell cycle protein [Faecalibacterium sp.]